MKFHFLAMLGWVLAIKLVTQYLTVWNKDYPYHKCVIDFIEVDCDCSMHALAMAFGMASVGDVVKSSGACRNSHKTRE
jgi:hypothetical protein